jgi:hypothetical protein
VAGAFSGRAPEGQFILLRHRHAIYSSTIFVVRLGGAAAPARFFTPLDAFGREPEGFFARPLAAFFPPDAADRTMD